jgi:seryl-tRNA synthetase
VNLKMAQHNITISLNTRRPQTRHITININKSEEPVEALEIAITLQTATTPLSTPQEPNPEIQIKNDEEDNILKRTLGCPFNHPTTTCDTACRAFQEREHADIMHDIQRGKVEAREYSQEFRSIKVYEGAS